MNIFILGGTGFLGYYASLELIKRGHTIRTLALPPAPADGVLPADMSVTLGDFNALTDEAVTQLMEGCEGVVFAGGVDDRVTPKAPAYEFFYRANVLSAQRFFRLARAAGAKRGVLLSSYFAHFDRIWPELHLADHHPYIRSRKEQEAAALEAAGEDLIVSILGLPYIFGQMPGKTPLWKPIVDYLHWPLPWVFYPEGGTAMVAVEQVAEAIAGALEENAVGGRYPIGSENLTWVEFLSRLGRAAGLEKKVVTLPNGLVRIGLWVVGLWHRLQGRESGLDPVAFLELQTKETFFDPEPAQKALGFSKGDLDQAFRETVRACGYSVEDVK